MKDVDWKTLEEVAQILQSTRRRISLRSTSHKHSDGKITIPEGQVCGHRWFGDTLHSYPRHFYPLTDKHQAGMSLLFLTYTIISQGFGHSLRVPFTWTMFFSCCRNGSPETSSSSPVLPSRHWAQPKSLLLLLADVLSTRSCSSVFPLSLCSLIQAIKSNCLTTGQTQPSPKQGFFWLFYSPVP